MSGYSKWDKFDPDLVCKEIEAQQAVESSKQAKKKAFRVTASENEQSIVNARKKAEALQAQADVAALKAKGIGGRRKRDKTVDGIVTSDPSVGQSSSIVPPLETKVKSVAEKLNLITDFLFQLLKKVELIRSYTEQKSSHEQGYHAAINCLHDIGKFSRIKNATILAALRAPSSNSTSNSTLKAPVKIIQDLNDSEAFLIDQTMNCLCLFALSRGEHALASDASRYVLKRQGSLADAGIWIMRGLAFAAMGVPFLARLHFTSALSTNAEYAGLQGVLPTLEGAAHLHARLSIQATKSNLVSKELARCLRSFFTQRSHILKTVPDLAVISVAEVKNFLAEGSLWQDDALSALKLNNSSTTTPILTRNSTRLTSVVEESIHMDEECEDYTTATAKNANTVEDDSEIITVSAIAHSLEQYTQEALKAKKAVDSPGGVLLSRLQREEEEKVSAGVSCADVLPAAVDRQSRWFAALAGLQMCRKEFYEAQMLYLEAFYQSAESKYAATILLIEAVRELLLLGRCAAIPLDSSTDNCKSNNNASNSSSCSVEVILSYLTQLSSACYINTAVCLVQHTITSAKLVQSAHDPSPPSLPPSSAPSAEIAVPAPKSVIELVGDASFLDTPLAWCKQGLALCDTLPGRLRLLLVLEKMHRFQEGLQECENMRVFIQRQKEQQGGNNTESSIPFECKQGVFALLPTAEHVLSQQFTTGCVLPMPVSSVLDSDIIPVTEVDKSGSGVSTSTSATTSSPEEEEMDFEGLLTGGGCMSGSVVETDASISADVWMTLLRSKSAHFEFQIRKYG